MLRRRQEPSSVKELGSCFRRNDEERRHGTIAFIGLGNMGGGMAANLVKAGHDVRAFDLVEDALARAEARGCRRAASARRGGRRTPRR